MKILPQQSKKLLSTIFATAMLCVATPALSADAPGWQESLRAGNSAFHALNLDDAQAKYQQAVDDSASRGVDAQILALMLQGQFFEALGKYALAEDCYRRASAAGASDWLIYLADVLAKQKKDEEAAKVRSQIHFFSVEEKKMIDDTYKRFWNRVMSAWPSRPITVISFNRASSIIDATNVSWVQVVARFTGAVPSVVAAVDCSSGDRGVERGALAAFDRLSMEKISNAPTHPFVLPMPFDFDVKMPPEKGEYPHRVTYQYDSVRRLASWQAEHLTGDHPEVAVSLTRSADLLLQLDKRKEAEAAYKRAAEIWSANGLKCSDAFIAFNAYGASLMKSKKYAEAEDNFAHAAKLAEEIYPKHDFHRVDCEKNLAKAMQKNGKKVAE